MQLKVNMRVEGGGDGSSRKHQHENLSSDTQQSCDKAVYGGICNPSARKAGKFLGLVGQPP